MIARMTSSELSHWLAFYAVRADEEEQARDLADSGDGQVIIHGRDPDRDDDEEDYDGD